MTAKETTNTQKMVGMGVLIALVVVLQVVAANFSISNTPIALTLVPIIIGAAMYGSLAGAALGAVFGIVVLLFGVTGRDSFTNLLLNLNPLATVALCIGKGAAAGFMAGVVYKLVGKFTENRVVRVACAAVICPVTNTGLFLAGMVVFFKETAISFAGESGILFFALFMVISTNFIVELVSNAVLSPAVARILDVVKNKRA